MKSPSTVYCLPSPLLWLASFACALYPLNAYQLELMAASVVLLLLWSCERLSRAVKDGLSAPRSMIVAVMAALWVLSFVSIAWSDVPWISLMSFFFMGALPVTFLTLALYPFTQNEWKVALVGVGAIMAVLGLWAMIQLMVFTDLFRGRAMHPLRDPNSLAALFNLALIPALGWLGLAASRRGVVGAFILCALLLGGMIATGSRGGFFMLAGGIVMLVLLHRRAAVTHWRRWAAIAVVLAGLLVAPTLVASDSRTTLGRVSATLDPSAPAISGDRLLTLRTAWAIVQENWVAGTGVGTFYLHYTAHRAPEQRSMITHAHNDPLQMWAEMGIAAPLLLYALLGMAAWATMRRARVLPDNGPARPRLIVSFVTLGVLMAHSHINLNLYNLSILMLAGLALSYWFAQLDVPRRSLAAPAGRGTQGALAVLFAIPVIFYGCMIASEHYLARAREAMIMGRIDVYGDAMLKADMLGFHRNPDVYLAAVSIPMGLLHHRKDTLEPDEWTKEAAQINNNLDAALAGNPLSAPAWYFKGLLAQIVPQDSLPDNLPQADEAFARALAIDPYHIGARLALIDQALERNDYDAAADIIRPVIQGVDLYTSAAMDIYTRALMVFTVLGDEEGSRKTIDIMRRYENRKKYTAMRGENAAWRLLLGQTFPQPVESSDE